MGPRGEKWDISTTRTKSYAAGRDWIRRIPLSANMVWDRRQYWLMVGLLESTASAGGCIAVGDVPDPQVPEKARRRTFTAGYKRDILNEYDRTERRNRGALLRREGLYASHIGKWRQQGEAGRLDGLSHKRGRRPADPAVRRHAELTRRIGRLEVELERTRKVIEVQSELSVLLESLLAAESPTTGGEQNR